MKKRTVYHNVKEKTYIRLETIKAPQALHLSVLASARTRERNAKVRQLLGWGMAAATSFAAIALSLISVSASLKASGTYEYISLLFTDSSALAFSKELALAVLESVPVFASAIFLASIGISIISAKRMKNAWSGTLFA